MLFPKPEVFKSCHPAKAYRRHPAKAYRRHPGRAYCRLSPAKNRCGHLGKAKLEKRKIPTAIYSIISIQVTCLAVTIKTSIQLIKSLLQTTTLLTLS